MKLLFTDSIMASLQEIGNQFLAGIPNFLQAAIILILGWIIVKAIVKAIKKLLIKLHVDKLGDKLNEIDIVAKSNVNIKISSLFARIIYYVLMLFVFVAATDALGMPVVSQLVSDIFNFIPNLIVAIIVLILGLLLSEAVRKIVFTTLNSLGVPSANLISTFLFYFLFINVVVTALSQAKINTVFLSQNLSLIIGGAVLAFGLGYGLAAKDVMANFLASFYLKDRFKIGDKITIGDVTGEIINLDRSSLTLYTGKSKIFVPLHKITTDKVEIHQ